VERTVRPEMADTERHKTPITGQTERLPTPTETHIALPLPLEDRRVTNGGGGGAHVRTAATDYTKFKITITAMCSSHT